MENQTSASGYGKRPLWQRILIYLIVAIVVYGGIYYFIVQKNGGYTPAPPETSTPPKQETPQATPADISANAQNTVTYTDAGFSPRNVTIKKGEVVVFKNTTSHDMHVASNPHPMHSDYPMMGGCVSSTFDSCSAILPGESWSFTFDTVGAWEYHNHLNSGEGGTITVK
ncbi:MAG: plastocyanin/azurin family copper-binding protein [bacterium]|nr:plastocyanin/azurin family copper-binding protein [bacterium]MDZ4299791.1 plastocyanin/azurin family copper-binding protein [Candidatus Sungbacteria bacterium]